MVYKLIFRCGEPLLLVYIDIYNDQLVYAYTYRMSPCTPVSQSPKWWRIIEGLKKDYDNLPCDIKMMLARELLT